MIGWFYYWTGERLLGIEEGGANGGEANGWGKYYPHGGALDPATGTWEAIPGLPSYEDQPERGVRVEAGAPPADRGAPFGGDGELSNETWIWQAG